MKPEEKKRLPVCDGDGPDHPEDDGLAGFRREQSRKCSLHNRKQTDEVLALIRKYRKDR